MTQPLITVLMPVYNAAPYLAEAIDSILNQRFKDFEFLIINDGSTDNSLEIINSYKDKRILLINNGQNIKLIATLNKGIELAQGKYIARMDADDISLPERLEKQVQFMETHPEVGLCGSFVRTVGLAKNYDVHYACSHDEIKFNLFFDTHFPHPAAFIRKSVLSENNLKFDFGFIHAEDFELWNRMAQHTRLAILPEILVHKRVHPEQISVKYTPIQLEVSSKIRRQLIKNLGIEPTDKEILLYDNFLEQNIPKEKMDVIVLLNFLDKLIKGNTKKKVYNASLFNNYFAQRYWDICTKSTYCGLNIYYLYFCSEASKIKSPSKILKIKFFLKALFRYGY